MSKFLTKFFICLIGVQKRKNKKLESHLDFHTIEISWISGRKSFHNFVTEIKKFKLTHTKEAQTDNTIVIPDDCEQKNKQHTKITTNNQTISNQIISNQPLPNQPISNTIPKNPTNQKFFSIFNQQSNNQNSINTDKQINKDPPKKPINKQTKKTNQKGTAPKAPTILETWLIRSTVPPT